MSSKTEHTVCVSTKRLMNHMDVDEKVFKKHVTSANGRVDASLPFLNDSSTDTVVRPRLNGKQRKCCQIPHSSISKDLIKKLIERGKHNLQCI